MTNHPAALSFAKDATVYAHAPAKEDVANLKAAYLEQSDRLHRAERERTRELDECPYCHKHEGGGVSPCVLHLGGERFKVEQLPDGMFQFLCPVCGVESGEVRNLQAAYTAAHSELERAVADLAACREVADGLRGALESPGHTDLMISPEAIDEVIRQKDVEMDAARYREVRKNPAMLLHLRNSEFDAAVDLRRNKGAKP